MTNHYHYFMTSHYYYFIRTRQGMRFYALLLCISLLLSSIFVTAQPSVCPDPGGGKFDRSLGSLTARSLTVYPGLVPAGHSGQQKGTVGYLYNYADASLVYPENTVTLNPLLNGITGGVALRFEVLSLVASGAKIEIFEGASASGVPRITITEINRATYEGTSVSYNGPVTVRFSSPTPAASGSFNVEIRYMTGDQIVTSCFNQDVAVWTDFVQPDSYTFIDDFTLATANTLPICIGYFDADRTFVSSEEAHCTIHDRKQVGVTMDTYPGEVSFEPEADKSNFDRLGSAWDVQQLKMARVAWLIANAPNTTRTEKLAVRNAIWTAMGTDYDGNWAGSLYGQAQAAIPAVPDPLPGASSLSMTAAPESVQPGNPVVFTLAVTGGTSPLRVKLDVPEGIIISGVTGAAYSDNYLEISSLPATVQITATSATEQSATLRAVMGAITDYWDPDNFKYFIPCEKTGADPFQDFIGYSVVEQMFPNAEASGIWKQTLPVSLIRFDAARENGNILLGWTTVAEARNRGFEVQRGHTAGAWEAIGFINSVSADGNNTAAAHYSFTDSKPLSGLNYYRLKQIDLDGSFAYSPIVSVRESGPGLYVYPNPVNNGVLVVKFLIYAGKVQVYSITGKELPAKMLDENKLDVSGLASGVYVLHLTTAEGRLASATFVVE